MNSTVIAFIVVGIIIIAVVCGIGVGTSWEKFNADNKDLEQRMTVKGQAGLDFLGTFVVVQVDQDTPFTLIDEIAEVDNWQCPDGEEGVCTGEIRFEVPSGAEQES